LKSGVYFNVNYENAALIIHGDPVSIRQVLHNLIKNALEAIDSQGQIDIDVHRVQKNNIDFIEIALHDDGVGIKDEQIEQIFEPYVTTKVKGTGLGLAIVKKIIEEHGGAIWVDTSRKVGAGFIIQLPAL
jgi:signal transduction histidine kinase